MSELLTFVTILRVKLRSSCQSIFVSHHLSLARRGIKTFVLDEADEMLSRGFKDQIYDVFRYMSNKIQVGFRLR